MRRIHVTSIVMLVFLFVTPDVGWSAPSEGGQEAGSALNIEVVGHHDLGGRGFNADVWTHEGFAYIGHWGFTDWSSGSKTRFCPQAPDNGVAVVDARDPARPVMVSRLQNPVGTSAEDVVVFTARHGPMAGRDIAAAGIQVCGGPRTDASIPRGLMLWDVTDPASPVELGFVSTGCCARGLHELEVQQRDDLGRIFAYASVPASRQPDPDSPSGFRDVNGDGDFRLIDITAPIHPVQVSDWGIEDIGGPFSDGQGCDPDPIFGHSAEPSDDGRLVFVSYWDSGFIALDVTDPAHPVFRGRTVYPADADGDGHSASFDDARRLLFTADEDFCPNSGPGIEKGWGYLRVYDYSNLAAPVQIGEY
ncbi:MAG: LVIVD repeat-containing protein, partial [Actinomycetota bacterium]